MALHLNLLHEEILELRLRQRDPLKIGMMVLAGIGALMFLWYMGKAYQTLAIRNRLRTVTGSSGSRSARPKPVA